MSATLIWTSIAPALASAAPATSVMGASPVLIGFGLMAIGVLCALVMLVAAALSTWTPPGLRKRWRPFGSARATRRLTALTQRASVVGTERAADTTLDIPQIELQGKAVDADAIAWRSLSDDIPGVGRIEWDPQTLRTFAGQPEVLYRLAFHRWRYQQGSFSEFDAARAPSRERA